MSIFLTSNLQGEGMSRFQDIMENVLLTPWFGSENKFLNHPITIAAVHVPLRIYNTVEMVGNQDIVINSAHHHDVPNPYSYNDIEVDNIYDTSEQNQKLSGKMWMVKKRLLGVPITTLGCGGTGSPSILAYVNNNVLDLCIDPSAAGRIEANVDPRLMLSTLAAILKNAYEIFRMNRLTSLLG